MGQRVVIIDDRSDRTLLMAQALRNCGYGVMMLKADNDDELYAGLCRLRPDILVIGEEVIIELESEDGARLMRQVGPAQEQVALPAG